MTGAATDAAPVFIFHEETAVVIFDSLGDMGFSERTRVCTVGLEDGKALALEYWIGRWH